MRLKEAVLGAGLLLTGCEKSPCEQVISHVEEGSYAAWHDDCSEANAKLRLAETAKQRCEIDLPEVTTRLKQIIEQNCK